MYRRDYWGVEGCVLLSSVDQRAGGRFLEGLLAISQ